MMKFEEGNTNTTIYILGRRNTQFFHKFFSAINTSDEYIVKEGGFLQVEGELSSSDSIYNQNKQNFTIILNSYKDLEKRFMRLSSEDRLNFSNTFIDEVRGFCNLVHGELILTNFEVVSHWVNGHYDSQDGGSFFSQLLKINIALGELSSEKKNLHIINQAALVTQLGIKQVYTPHLYFSTEIVYSLAFDKTLASHTTHLIKSLRGSRIKCLVLDLDNTLWGGVLGELGVNGIKVGNEGTGRIFLEFQKWLIELKYQGMILAICSKNTESNVFEVFRDNSSLGIARSDFSVIKANWENKDKNILEIINELNIGADSVMFLDDNPAEREIVKNSFPTMVVPDLPKEASDYLPFIQGLGLINNNVSSGLNRSQAYIDQANRVEFEQKMSSYENFLTGLEMKGSFDNFNSLNIDRVSELSNRSNQFNLRTIRWTLNEAEQVSENKKFINITFNLSDKFGDYGLISYISATPKSDKVLFINNWVMSCRALKRKVEFALFNKLVQEAQAIGYKTLSAEYLPTPRNVVVENLLSNLGFYEKDKTWEFNLEEFIPFETEISLI